jgi:excisionase family DNA binding protein
MKVPGHTEGEEGVMDKAEKRTKSESEALLTPAEVAALFRVDPKTVTRWTKTGTLTSIRTLEGHRRYRETEVRQLLRAFNADDEISRTGHGASAHRFGCEQPLKNLLLLCFRPFVDIERYNLGFVAAPVLVELDQFIWTRRLDPKAFSQLLYDIRLGHYRVQDLTTNQYLRVQEL